ncbi:MAG: hypothetical protein PVF75_03410 [Granulosicoccaceae bacterium]
MKKVTIFVNNQAVYEYDKEVPIDDQKLAFLDKMDSDMARGIKIQGELIPHPDKHQRATFVTMNFIRALQQENEVLIAAYSAYLANRLPGLVEVHANDHGSRIKIELVEEE